MKKFRPRKTLKARQLRNEATPAERKLWGYLSARKVDNVRFNRQVCIGPYICDFAARTQELIIEVDGESHGHRIAYDAARTKYLENEGYRVIRFWNDDVMNNADGVVLEISNVIRNMPSPNPSRNREGNLS